MKKVHVLSVVGARPNFMKMAPVLRQLAKHSEFESRLVHTGQHYDESMSRIFFHDLNMPDPDVNLNVGSGSHAVQTAQIMMRFEEVCEQMRPDLVIVAGDVNSTLACSLTAAKLQIPVAHIESGLRSSDRTMPEEINRIVTDSIANVLFTTEESGNRNLRAEGIARERIHFVGNTMIDSLVNCYKFIDRPVALGPIAELDSRRFFLATIHRPSNVDEPAQLLQVLEILKMAGQLAPVFFVTHPRTRERLERLPRADKLIALSGTSQNIQPGFIYLLPPLAYIEFLRLMSRSIAVLTDSGGIQEETTFLGIPCLTLRKNTERPVTVDVGSNELVGLDREKIAFCLEAIVSRRWKKATPPPLWDGAAAERVIEVLKTHAIS